MARRRSSLRITSNTGMLCLAAWLILSGLSPYIPAIRSLGAYFPLLALLAGVLILMGR